MKIYSSSTLKEDKDDDTIEDTLGMVKAHNVASTVIRNMDTFGDEDDKEMTRIGCSIYTIGDLIQANRQVFL